MTKKLFMVSSFVFVCFSQIASAQIPTGQRFSTLADALQSIGDAPVTVAEPLPLDQGPKAASQPVEQQQRPRLIVVGGGYYGGGWFGGNQREQAAAPAYAKADPYISMPWVLQTKLSQRVSATGIHPVVSANGIDAKQLDQLVSEARVGKSANKDIDQNWDTARYVLLSYFAIADENSRTRGWDGRQLAEKIAYCGGYYGGVWGGLESQGCWLLAARYPNIGMAVGLSAIPLSLFVKSRTYLDVSGVLYFTLVDVQTRQILFAGEGVGKSTQQIDDRNQMVIKQNNQHRQVTNDELAEQMVRNAWGFHL